MSPSKIPDTRMSLLVRLPDLADNEAWDSFVSLYGPLVYGFSVRRGCSSSDASDVVQEVMLKISRAIGTFEYDPNRGKFRSWVFTIAHNHLASRYRKKSRRPQLEDGAEWVEERVARERDRASDPEQIWEMEYQRQLAYAVLPELKRSVGENAWAVFSGAVLEGREPSEVAAELKMSVGNVYVLKSRMLARLRREIERLEAEWEAA